jgi:putative transposase
MPKKSKYTEEQIIQALREVAVGTKASDVCRLLGVTETTFYRWKSKYGGMEVSEAKRLKQLEDENRRLKQLVAEKELDLQML